jgi:hypothetical protein
MVWPGPSAFAEILRMPIQAKGFRQRDLAFKKQ